MSENRIWLITGATSGFGRALVEAAAGDGDVVVGAARHPGRLDDLVAAFPGRVHPMALDVTDTERGPAVVREVAERFGRLDVLVNNAGRTQVGALEESSDDALRSLFDLHFFGPAALTRAALPVMRRSGSGTVVQMSSVGGQVTAPGFGAYCATKFALEGLTETLRQEVGFGVRFMIVEPGAFRTNLFDPGAMHASPAMPEYADTVGPIREFLRTGHGTQPGDPAKAARAILTALDAPEPPLRLVLGGQAIDDVRDRLGRLGAELDQWAGLGRDTDLEPQVTH
jgi:NAD(P)-dependent dehydrogenase (short-subunit alcohol dehydrogenase family)